MQVFMKGKINILYKDKFLRYSSTLTAVFLLAVSSLVVFSYPHLPPLVPLFNSMPWGMMRLYSGQMVIILPIFVLAVVLINMVLVITIYKKFTLLARIISFNSFLFCLLGTFAYLQILFLIY